MSKIYHAHLYGLREDKYQVLKENTVNSTDFHEVNPQSPFYLLIPQDTDLLGEYEQGFKLTEFMNEYSLGCLTKRDKLVINYSINSVKKQIASFLDPEKTDNQSAQEFNLRLVDNDMWNTNMARKSVDVNQIVKYIKSECFRPFDNRFIFYHEKFVARLNRRIMQHLDQKKNIALVTVRQLASLPFEHIYVTDNLTDQHIISVRTKEGGVIFPLYLYPDSDKAQELQQEKRPNFSPDFLKTLETKLGYLPTPETIFYYIYAVFHSPTYRSRYAEFLKIDFPRVPLTSNDNLFRQLAEYGEQLVQLHLMTSPKLDPPLAPSSKRGGVEAPLIKGGWGDLSFVSKSDRIVAAGHPKYSKGEVHINKQGDCFRGVPEAVWNFYIGGYQVCQKWLKDRKGRTLSDEDILHYHKIVVALAETIKLMQLIDAAIPGFPIE
ncbi:hypothetical protein O53_3188 [Microcystis aeruginosa TAIHU98]|uniref:Type ISP restriction-modification enzyme LLaBIII C-terminal specificity domain-containing protein n=1 Tax=Microcystis aeruginosa TAIHU98 TaxID=1134457 RepID=L7E4I2_MICAE|nr:type ISP restriction/modification enzyme [Microcystis aeruginosa]ELP54370.1 hypothetical protein O53_3188 [Microcystis aeruginosa TAIHU98]